MKLYKVKTPALTGAMTTIATLRNGIVSVRDAAPALSVDGDLMPGEFLINAKRWMTLSQSEFSLSLLTKVRGDHTVISLHKTRPPEHPSAFVDVFSKTVNGRVSMLDYTRSTRLVHAHIFTPFADSELNECAIVVPEAVGGELIVEGFDLQAREFSSFEDAVENLLPSLAISNPVQKDGLITSNVILTDQTGKQQRRDATVFVESTLGNVLTPRVNLKNGAGEVIVTVSGLPRGLSGRIKVGFRYYPGKAEAQFES